MRTFPERYGGKLLRWPLHAESRAGASGRYIEHSGNRQPQRGEVFMGKSTSRS